MFLKSNRPLKVSQLIKKLEKYDRNYEVQFIGLKGLEFHRIKEIKKHYIQILLKEELPDIWGGGIDFASSSETLFLNMIMVLLESKDYVQENNKFTIKDVTTDGRPYIFSFIYDVQSQVFTTSLICYEDSMNVNLSMEINGARIFDSYIHDFLKGQISNPNI